MNINLWQNTDKYQDPLSSTPLRTCGVSGTILDFLPSPEMFMNPQGLLSFLSSFSHRLQVPALLEQGLSPHRMGQLGQRALQRVEATLKARPGKDTPLRNLQKDLHLLKTEATRKAQVNSNWRSQQLHRDPGMNHHESLLLQPASTHGNAHPATQQRSSS